MTAAGPRWSRRSASAGDAVVRPRLRGRGAQLSLSLRAASHPELRRVPHGPDVGRAGGAPGHGPGPCAVVRGRVLPHLHRAWRDGVRPGRAAAPFPSLDRADRRRRRHPVRAVPARRGAPGAADARAQGPARAQAAGLARPFVVTALALDRFLAWFQRFRPYLVWVERIAGILLILLGLLLVTDRFTLLASWLQGLTPEFLKSRL